MTTRPPDPRGANRRSPSQFGSETGYDTANDAPTKRKRWTFPELHVIPDEGCHMYQRGTGVVYCRCPKHQPANSHDLGPVAGQCVTCAAGRV